MKENDVHPIPLVAYAQPLLTTHEGEIVSEFQKEMLEMQDQGLLQLAFNAIFSAARIHTTTRKRLSHVITIQRRLPDDCEILAELYAASYSDAPASVPWHLVCSPSIAGGVLVRNSRPIAITEAQLLLQ